MAGGNSARDLGLPVVHYLRKQFALSDLLTATAAGQPGVSLGPIPAGAIVLQTIARVDQAFNATLTNVLTVGFDNAVSNLAGGADITEGSTQTQVITTGAGQSPTVDSDVYAKFTQTGTAASTGQATIVVTYVPSRPLN